MYRTLNASAGKGLIKYLTGHLGVKLYVHIFKGSKILKTVKMYNSYIIITTIITMIMMMIIMIMMLDSSNPYGHYINVHTSLVK